MPNFFAEIVSHNIQLDIFQEDWNLLSKQTKAPHASYEKYCEEELKDDTSSIYLVVLRKDDHIVALAPFVLRKTRKSYALGERRLFSLPVTTLQLVGGGFIGELDKTYVHYIFEALAARNDFDFIPLGEVELNGDLHQVLRDGLANSPWRCAHAGHKTSLHWLIHFPSTFDNYMAEFSGKTRSSLRRKVRKFDNHNDGTFRVISRAGDVGEFLEAGEKISRLSYQWNVGQRLYDDELTKQSFTVSANKGELRSYLLYAKGKPCAFMRGSIKGGIYQYDTPGFDPEYDKLSPGTVLFLKAVDDLITNTNCKTFDFGVGGDMTGYKKIFGNSSYETIAIDIGRPLKPYTLLLFSIQDILSGLKRLGNVVLSDRSKRFIKQRIRKYGS